MSLARSEMISKERAEFQESLFDRIIEVVEDTLPLQLFESEKSPIRSFQNKSKLKKRLIQSVIAQYEADLSRAALEQSFQSFTSASAVLTPESQRISLRNGVFDLQKGCLQVSLGLRLRWWIKTSIEWAALFFSSFWGSLLPIRKKKFVLVLGAPLLNAEDAERFFEQTEIPSLRNASHRLVEFRGKVPMGFSSSRNTFSFRPLWKAVQYGMKLRRLPRFVVNHLRNGWDYLFFSWRYPQLLFLGRDFVWAAAVEAWAREGLLEAVFITNTYIYGQPLWMSDLPHRKFRTHMVWYSTNNRPSYFSKNTERAQRRLKRGRRVHAAPIFHTLQFDEGWYWNKNQAHWMTQVIGEHTTHISGPCEFRVIQTVEHPPSESFRIALFDVTPASREFIQNLGLAFSIYDPEVMKHFVSDILEVVSELSQMARFEVGLKGKRPATSIHDLGYLEFLKTMEQKYPFFELIDPQTQASAVCARSHMTLVFPYSSPAYLAKAAGKASFYYDPVDHFRFDPFRDPEIDLLVGKAELKRSLLREVSLHFPHSFKTMSE